MEDAKEISSETVFHLLVSMDVDGGFVGKVCELEGCHTQGDTLDELVANAKEAIILCLQESIRPSTNFIGVLQLEI